MDVYYERVNQRYRGPFEQEKLAFLLNQIKRNIAALYAACEKQKNEINKLQDINENQGFDFSFTPDSSDEEIFENSFRDNLESVSKKSLSKKERIRDYTCEVEEIIYQANELT